MNCIAITMYLAIYCVTTELLLHRSLRITTIQSAIIQSSERNFTLENDQNKKLNIRYKSM